MFVAYEVLLYLVSILGLPFFLVLGLIRGKYVANLLPRLGVYGSVSRAHDLWIHAVSVGEALAAQPVVAAIRRARPGTSIVVTTTTLTGQAQARRIFPEATVTYFPLDFSFAVRRFLRHHSPRVFATMETEIWPNVTRLSRASGIRLAIANGRISDRSYPRYRRFRALLAPILRNYDRILVREELDRERFVAMGADPVRVERAGNVKFDFEPSAEPLPDADAIAAIIAGRRVVAFGSTIEGEDELLLGSIASIAKRGLFVIVAPRKPERFDPVERLLRSAGLRVLRRSAMLRGVAGPADVLLLDTMGELSRIYRFAAVAFVGGSLVPHGGHNPIEPAALGLPVSFGPSMSNFREIADVFVRAEAAVVAETAADVEAFVVRMADDPALAAAWGERARTTVMQNRGASERTARRIVELLS